MDIIFVKGIFFRDTDKLKKMFYSIDNTIYGNTSLGMLITKNKIHFRPIEEGYLIRDDNYYTKPTILVVEQDKPIDTIKTIIHELIHWMIFRFFCDWKKLHKLLDRKWNFTVDKH